MAGSVRPAGTVLTVTVLAAAALTGCAAGTSTSAGGGATQQVSVTLSNAGCPVQPSTIAAGAVTVTVTNSGGTAVSEAELMSGSKILAEKEGLTPGLTGTFSLTLAPGRYEMYCPNAGTERSVLTVTGGASAAAATATSTAAAALGTATTKYRSYVAQQVQQLITATSQFVASVKASDVAAAKAFYASARAPYERIEPVAESFGDLDPRIDARAGDVPAAQWGGFHRIEQQLWVAGNTTGMTPVADRLLADVAELQDRVADTTFQPADLANGAAALLTEIGQSKVTGEEERYSHTDLSDIAANIAGSRAALDLLAPALAAAGQGRLTDTINSRRAAVDALLVPLRSGSGYVGYGSLSTAQVRALTAAVDALAEPVATVGEQIVAIR